MLDNETISSRAAYVRKKIGEDSTSPIDVFSIAHHLESLSLLLFPLGANISGACLKSEESSLIAINSSMSLGRQRFSLAHEFYHFYFDQGLTSTICHLTLNPGNSTEREANTFASYFLVPPAALLELVTSSQGNIHRELSLSEVIKLEQFFGVSRKAILTRLISEKLLSEKSAANMESNVILSAINLGYDTALYKPTPDADSRRTYGHYIKQVDLLFRSEIISYGKYKELLLDAYRDDILFGTNADGGEYVD